MMRSYLRTLAAALGLALCPLTASAAPVDTSTFSCKDLTESGESKSKSEQYGASVLLYWMAGYHATDEQNTVVDFDNLIKEFGQTAEFCSKNPAISVLTATTKFMGENAAPATPKAIDLATITCKHANETSSDETDGLGQILMWLSGYHKSVGETTILDMDEFEASVEKIAKYCAESPSIGLFTASEKFMSEPEDEDDKSDKDDSKE